jgi:UDP-3-O-[3-hydroxymyristoyl] N-acetylglucosamine deacetylase
VDRISFHGRGLHTGEPCAVTLVRTPGPVCFASNGEQVSREQLEVVRAQYGVRVRGPKGRPDIDLVEHLFAAFAGLAIQHGVTVHVQGPEIPLLDGSAYELAMALRALGAPRSAPRLRVVQAGEVLAGESRYSFEPGNAVEITVEVHYDVARLGRQRASWDGGSERFLAELARARTFGFRRQYAELRALGRAKRVDPRSVMVLEADGSVAPPGAPPGEAELARHKLLDLLGDLYFFGGPPLGKLVARRPGHRANHQAARQALEYGLLVRTGALRNGTE